MKLIAHRGFAGEHPENTLAAFRAAVEDGADAVELDVRRCGSGELVVCHDATLDRVTDASGPVGAFDHDDLRRRSVLGSGEGIPALVDVFEALPAGVGVNVELKEDGLAAEALAVADRFPHEVLVSSFEPGHLDAAREAESAVDRAIVFARAAGDHLALADRLDCTFVHPHLSLCPGTDLVAAAHDRGLGVNAWTVETAAQARRLREAGVDGVIADRPDVLPE